jgi:hypothetical protein
MAREDRQRAAGAVNTHAADGPIPMAESRLFADKILLRVEHALHGGERFIACARRRPCRRAARLTRPSSIITNIAASCRTAYDLTELSRGLV